MHEDGFLKDSMPLQSEVVHQCVMRLPLETIVSRCSDKGVVTRFMRQVEELDAEDSVEAIDICSGATSDSKASTHEKGVKRLSSLSRMTATKQLHFMRIKC